MLFELLHRQAHGFRQRPAGTQRFWNTQFIDNLSWIKGRHTLKFGVDIRRPKQTLASPPVITTATTYFEYIHGHAWLTSFSACR